VRILLINQFFWPDSAATSQFLTDVARRLEEDGHEVFVIASQSGYAPQDEDNPPGASIHRVKGAPFGWGVIGRILSYASFFVGCALRGLKLPRPDVVLTLTTPPLISLVGTLIKAVRRSRHFIWEMDVYPEVATDIGFFKRGGVLEATVGMLADFSHSRSDGVIALGECMRQRLVSRGLPPEKIHVAENWADGNLVHPLARQSKNDKLVVLYSGNLGLAHDIETVSEAIKELELDARFRFVFAGNGPKRRAFEEKCEAQKIKSVEFCGYTERGNLGESLARGDIGLVTQRAECLGSVVPSKVYSLLAAGRPILFIGPQGATPAEIIRHYDCGWHIQNGDVPGLVRLLRQLSIDRALVHRSGDRARQAFLNNYDRDSGVSRICKLIGASPKRMMAGAA